MSNFGDDIPKSRETAPRPGEDLYGLSVSELDERITVYKAEITRLEAERCLLYTSPSPRDKRQSRMPSSA